MSRRFCPQCGRRPARFDEAGFCIGTRGGTYKKLQDTCAEHIVRFSGETGDRLDPPSLVRLSPWSFEGRALVKKKAICR